MRLMDGPLESPLLILGTSARAAAGSARRRGRIPWCIDLFDDLDLRALSPRTRRLDREDFPEGFLTVARDFPSAPFLAAGGLEDHPEVIARLEAERPNEGTASRDLVRARDPGRLQELARDCGFPATPTRTPDGRGPERGLPAELAGPWILKLPGIGSRSIIRRYRSLEEALAAPAGGVLQAERPGVPVSAAYYRRRHGPCEFLGLALQLVGCPFLAAPEDTWCGNVGPLEVPETLRAQLEHLGETTGEEFDLRSHFGIDFMRDGELLWPLELNPRYPASVEIHERALDSIRPDGWPTPHGKGVLFAREEFVMPALEPLERDDAFLADVTPPGTRIEAGEPILTVITRADTVERAHEKIEVLSRKLYNDLSRDPHRPASVRGLPETFRAPDPSSPS